MIILEYMGFVLYRTIMLIPIIPIYILGIGEIKIKPFEPIK